MAAVTTAGEGLQRLPAAAESGELAELCQRYHGHPAHRVRDAARGEPDPQNLDIEVLTEHGPDFDLFGFVTDMIGLVGCEQVDVAHLDAAGLLLRERALVGSIILYECDPGTWARVFTAAVMERMDTDWLRRLSLKLLAG